MWSGPWKWRSDLFIGSREEAIIKHNILILNMFHQITTARLQVISIIANEKSSAGEFLERRMFMVF